MDIRNLLQNLEPRAVQTKPKAGKKKKESGPVKFKGNAVKGYKPADNRQVTHNLRRRMGR